MYISRLNCQGVGYSTGIVHCMLFSFCSNFKTLKDYGENAIRSVESSVIQSCKRINRQTKTQEILGLCLKYFEIFVTK